VDGPERPPTTPPSAAAARPPAAASPPSAAAVPPSAAAARPPLPTGTVTFLFTDIEGSTRLARDLGDAWPALLERHREIIRTALAAHGGIEVQTEGDGFFAAFTRAPAAVAATVRAQRDLAAEPWPADAQVRVRMGLHAGEGVTDMDGSYVGHDVHRAARVAGAAHGGQVLVSETVRALAAATLPADVTLRDLGEHRLKDLRPQPLAQLVIAGLPAEFPPVRSLDLQPNNLPTQLTSFVGREKELAAAAGLLATTRLLTLTGPGGTGKTRLALHLAASVADDYPDGTWFVALEPLRDPTLVLPTVARTLGVFQKPADSALDALVTTVGDRRMLFVLDNFEQVIEAAADIGDLLRACPRARVIVTSRAVLRVSGEQEYVVPGLPAPPDTSRLSRVELENLPATVRHPDPAGLGQYEAVRLFIARAIAVRPEFRVTNENAPAVAGICARLHGMPLAIELAAARVKLLAPEQILERLEQQLGILTSTARDLPDRQRTLRGAIAWSCDLLDEPQRQLLARLSVFRGGWDLDAAEAVAGSDGATSVDVLDGLAALVDQSLVRSIDESAAPRFDMFETIREFAEELLVAAGDAAATRETHARVFLGLAERLAPLLHGAGQREWLDHLEHDHDNLRAALSWATERPEPEMAVRLCYALWRFWQQRGYLEEARARLDRIAAQARALPAPLRARFAEARGGVAYWQADLVVAETCYDEALEIWRERAAGGDPADRRELANALYNRAFVTVAAVSWTDQRIAADRDRARAMLEEALAIYRELGDTAGEGNVVWGLGGLELYGHDAGRAEPWFRRSLELHRAAGNRTMEAWSLHMLGVTMIAQERIDEAAEASRHAVMHFRDAHDLAGLTLSFDVLAAVAVARGDQPRGGRLWGLARQLEEVSGAGLAAWDEAIFAGLPASPRARIEPAELERLAAEGAALPLADAVAYALEERDPFDAG
jgi:predicted ATPase/class 3 adenylate cyclase